MQTWRPKTPGEAPCAGSGGRWSGGRVPRCPECGRGHWALVERSPTLSTVTGWLGHVPTHSAEGDTVLPRATLPRFGTVDVEPDPRYL